MTWSLLIVLIIFLTPHSTEIKKIEGVYYTHGKIISSELSIKSDNRFEYFYRLGGCQGTVYGKWKLNEKRLILNADDEFLRIPSKEYPAIYPRFETFVWKVKRKGLRPTKEIDTGCFQIKRLHRKIK